MSEFKIKTMGHYYDLYVLLADVFDRFRKAYRQSYKLGLCHDFNSPCWNAMLKKKKAELELMTDVDIYQFTEKDMRGEVSYNAQNYSKANDANMTLRGKNKSSIYITYLDKKYPFVRAMIQCLP